MTIQFYALGIPKGQPRPKAFARGGHAAVYDPGTAEGWKSQVADAAKGLVPSTPLHGPLRLDLFFAFPRPKTHYGSGKNAARIKEGSPLYHTSKPDSDNLSKAVMDAMTQLNFWVDDSNVAMLKVQKTYADGPCKPGCEIILSTL